MITYDELRSLLRYDPDSGLFYWLVSRRAAVSAGDVAGTKDVRGYICIMINRRLYKAHRLAWLYMTGRMPELTVDHKDLQKSNNRWENLRQATMGQQIANRTVDQDSKSGFKGVYKSKKIAKPWRAAMTSRGRRIHIGYFDSPEEAHAAYCQAAVIYHGEFARG